MGIVEIFFFVFKMGVDWCIVILYNCEKGVVRVSNGIGLVIGGLVFFFLCLILLFFY